MTLQFGVFDHIEPVEGMPLQQIYDLRLEQIEALDQAGFYAYHLAEHHTPAVHSLAPSQNVFLAAVSQRTTNLRFGPCVCATLRWGRFPPRDVLLPSCSDPCPTCCPGGMI